MNAFDETGAAPEPGAPVPGDASATARPGAKPSSWALPLRIVSGLLFVPILILLAHVGGLAFLAFVMLQVTLALTEFFAMMRGKGLHPAVTLGTLAALGIQWACYRPNASELDLLATAAILLLLALVLRRPEIPRQAESVAVTLFGVLYVGWMSAHLVLLRELPWRAGTTYGEGAAFVLLAFFVTWSCDTGAFAIGKWFGRTRPWARISPGKTMEGSAGGLAFALIAAFVARAWFAPFLRVWDAAAIGLLVGVFAQVGDLVESLLKRDARHGDSSDLIPGHGGVLDRFDSLYFAAPIVFYYLKVVVYQVP